jgi:hypothetical protein
MASIDDIKKAGKILQDQLSASVNIHIVRHPDDNRFESTAPCFRITVTAVDPESNKIEDGPRWRDISATATVDESTFVIKAEKLAGWAARTFKRRKPRQLHLKIIGKPLAAWEDKYEALDQTETIAAGDQTTIRLAFKPKEAHRDTDPASGRKGLQL